MKREEMLKFILDKVEENRGHIGMPHKIEFNNNYTLRCVLTDVNIYNNGDTPYIIYTPISGRTHNCPLKDRTDELINAVYKEVLNNRYL